MDGNHSRGADGDCEDKSDKYEKLFHGRIPFFKRISFPASSACPGSGNRNVTGIT
jgi:hypothetical protein